jgi:hypothetical protein
VVVLLPGSLPRVEICPSSINKAMLLRDNGGGSTFAEELGFMGNIPFCMSHTIRLDPM